MAKTVDLDIPHDPVERERRQRNFLVGNEAKLMAEIERLRMNITAIRDWTLLQDDTVWFSTITTLHDFCEQSLNEQLTK